MTIRAKDSKETTKKVKEKSDEEICGNCFENATDNRDQILRDLVEKTAQIGLY